MSFRDEITEAFVKAKDAECVGCGYCCRKAPCAVANRVYGNGLTECPALSWDEDQKRYFCELCLIPTQMGVDFKKELSVGEGCCSPLFNTERENIRPPEGFKRPVIDKQLRAMLHCMGKGLGFSGDALWLLIHATAKELGEDKEWVKACFRALKEERSQFTNDFMGELREE
jgi:hypothetical protein